VHAIADEDRMKRNRAAALLVVVLLGILASSCGGGGNPIIIGGLVALFTPDAASADPRMSMEEGPAAGDIFSIEIHANALDNLYGAAFTLLYDPNETTYLGCDAGGSILTTSVLPSISCDDTLVGGARFAAALENDIPGTLNVLASLDGLVPGVANGTGLLLTLTFQAGGEILPPGEPFTFEAGSSREIEICEPGGPPLPACTMPVVPWDEGSVVATLG
jgi:hypothetical protein